MRKERIIGLTFVALVLAVLLIAGVSANISFENQNVSVYNIGDEFNMNIKVSSDSNSNGFFIAKFSCSESGSDFEIYKAPLVLNSEEEKEISIEAILSMSLIDDSNGECIIKAEYLTEIASSDTFEVSKDVDVELTFGNTSFDPGSKITLSGKATKKNGNVLNGVFHAYVTELGIDSYTNVTDGNINGELEIPGNAKAKEYTINAEAYEEENDKKTNQGKTTDTFSINQVASRLEISSESQQVKPGKEISYIVSVFDQADDRYIGQANVEIRKPTGEIEESKNVDSWAGSTFKTRLDSPPGIWSINAKANSLSEQRTFIVEEQENIEFSIVNSSLIVKNTGNIPIEKQVGVKLGSNESSLNMSVNLSLAIGESQEFKLSARKRGDYNVVIADGDNESPVGTASLTGKAGFGGIGAALSSKQTIIAWIVLIIIIIAVIVYYSTKKYRNNGIPRASMSSHTEQVKTLKMGSAGSVVPLENSKEGNRENCAVVALKIRNMADIEKNEYGQATLRSVIGKAREAGAKVYGSDDFRIMIFSPSLTKEENNVLAIKVAKDIENMIIESNKKYTQQVNFGIAVHAGEMIRENTDGNVKFTSIGNILVSAKRLADNSKGGLLISESVHGKVIGKIRAERAEVGFKVKEIIDRDKHSKFLKGFMKRQEDKK